MNTLCKIRILGILFLSSSTIQLTAQNLETMLIEKSENASLVVPEQCKPENIIIVINSSIQNLKFESNMLPDSEFITIHYEESNQYIICHEKMKFILTVSGPNLQSENLEITDLNKPQAYTISANIVKGKVNILTNPRNATVIFPELNNLVLSTNQPITNVSGKYHVNIVKPHYKNVDTVIVIPRDAEKTYSIDLVPLFSRIKLNLTTEDNTPFLRTPVLWIDSVKIELDGLVKAGMNQRSFFDDVEYLKFYEGNIVPLQEGIHTIKIEAESYIPFKTFLEAKNGKIHNINVSLEPIYGFLTFIDKQYGEGTTIYVDNLNIGKVPVFKVKTKVGKHTVRFEKPGYISPQEEYSIFVQEKQNIDVDVNMAIARKINFETEPTNAEVFMDGTRFGFTPFSTVVNAGNHEILVRKSGYASEKFLKQINEQTANEELVQMKLRTINPITIRSEEDSLLIQMKGINNLGNIIIENTPKTPSTIQLPYGKYKISLSRNGRIVYKSTIEHSPDILKYDKIPAYSKGAFHILTANYENSDNFEASFGRIHIFPGSGLSTSIINLDYRYMSFKTPTKYYNFKTLAPNIIFLNWEWRLGGSILRQLDVNLLGMAKYTPGLKSITANIQDFTDVALQNYFYGIEFSTRLSYCNLSFRYGRQTIKGKINLYDSILSEYIDSDFPINESRNVASIGITFNGRVSRSNNMLRLWQKPLISFFKHKKAVNAPEQSTISTEKK
jgi:hypothetical protein